ncbi:hypothetical protein ACFRAE_08455 [Sphingobacterium sp. HJSM2_6]|uniref:hypothetical protein n=1 Tax=Sphingobacterium sp. HJSM2_6 TaxID=3366264 RepID=UPI003BD6D4E0
MRNFIIGIFLCLTLFACSKNDEVVQNQSSSSGIKSIREFNVLPSNNAETNRINLQNAIDWASVYGASLYVEPSDEPYAINGGIILKKNVSLIGANAATPRGTKNPIKNAPVGSVFKITDKENAFITVESATQIKGIQFWYAEQELIDPTKIIEYPATIQVSKTSHTEGVTLSNLTFYGEYISMDFAASAQFPCELLIFEHCYGYPLSGQFIKIDYCYDIPRILHCHVNPAINRSFGPTILAPIIDAVIEKETFAYNINHTDNAQLIDVFSFGTFGGALLGEDSYGQLTNFNFDCVKVGIHKKGSNSTNRNWQVSQGSIISNAGTDVSQLHPFIIEGKGHIAITNVEAFSGNNPALTNTGISQDFMLVRGNDLLSISIFGSRMRNYQSDNPITIENTAATIQAIACIDKEELMFNLSIQGVKGEPNTPPNSSTVQVMDFCEDITDWHGNVISLDNSDFKEGNASIASEGGNIVIFQKKYNTTFDTKVTKQTGIMSFWLYVSDVSKFVDSQGNGSIEITSSGGADVNEYAWNIDGQMNLQNGWNKVVLRLSNALTTNGDADLTELNFIRVFKQLSAPIVMKIDHIRFSEDINAL